MYVSCVRKWPQSQDDSDLEIRLKNFSDDAKLEDVVLWAKSLGPKIVNITIIVPD